MAVYTAAGHAAYRLGEKVRRPPQALPGDRKVASSYHFLWVTDFPMFEWDEENKRWAAAHHPFTSPHDHDMDKLESDPGTGPRHWPTTSCSTARSWAPVRSVFTGRIFSRKSSRPRHDERRGAQRFGFFLEALTYGTPPHGGIALGLDRIVMILAGAEACAK